MHDDVTAELEINDKANASKVAMPQNREADSRFQLKARQLGRSNSAPGNYSSESAAVRLIAAIAISNAVFRAAGKDSFRKQIDSVDQITCDISTSRHDVAIV